MAEEIVDALVLQARFDEQGLNESSRRVLNRLEAVSREAQKLGASGQRSPAATTNADIVKATQAFNAGTLSLEGYNVALQQAKQELIALEQAGYAPNTKQLLLLDSAIERTTRALAQQASVAKRAAQETGASARQAAAVDPFAKVAKGGAGFAAGLARARSGLAQVAVTAVGTSSAVGQVVQSLLLLSGVGVVGIIAISAAVAAAAKVFENLTGATREAKKAREELNQANSARVSGSLSDETRQMQELAAAEETRALQAKKIQDFEHGAPGAILLLITQAAKRRELAAQTLKVEEGIVLLQQKQADLLRGQILQAAQSALKVEEARLQAAEQNANFQAQLAQAQGVKTFNTPDQTLSNEVLASFQKRLDIVQATGRAELGVLELERSQAQQRLAKATPGSDVERESQERLTALDAEIAARKIVLGTQLEAIRNERTLATVTEDRARSSDIADFQRRLADAGQEAENAGLATAKAWGDDAFAGIEKAAGAMDDFRKNTREATDGLMSAQEIIDEFANALADSVNVGTAGPEQFQQIRQEMERQLNIANDQTKSLDERNRAMELYNRLVQASHAPAIRLSQGIDNIVSSALRVGDALGIMNQQAQQAFHAMSDLAFSIASGDILGAFASGVELLSGVFGKDATQREDDSIRRQNIDALERNTAQLKASGGLGDTVDAIRALEQVSRRQDFIGTVVNNPDVSNTVLNADTARALDVALKDAGSSLAELQIAAEAQGITLLDSKGRLVAGALDALKIAMEDAAQAALKFKEDVASEEARLTNEDRINRDPNRTEAQDKQAALERERTVQLDALNLPDAEESRIKALNLSTQEGRDAFLEWERDILKRAKEGTLTKEELGKFKNVDELVAALADGADAVNAFNDATKDATEKLGDFDLPPGFKRAALVFANEATGPSRPNDGAQQPLPPTPLRGTDLIPNLPDEIQVKLPPPGTPEATPAPSTTTVQPGAVTVQITVSGAGDPAAVAEAVRKVVAQNIEGSLRKIGFVQSGDTMQLGLR